MAIEIGRVCIKIAGREAGKKCVVVDIIDKNYVVIDGDLRRKKCNIRHIEPLEEKLEIEKNEAHDSVMAKLEGIGIKQKRKFVVKGSKDKAEKKEKSAKKEKVKEKKK